MQKFGTNEPVEGGIRSPGLTQALASALLVAFALAGAGCEREGPAERAGEAIDESVEKAKDTVSDAAEEAEEQAREIKEETEEKIKD
jgi:L-2-hydroxyglutarate oxidase LhgO